MDGVDYLLPGTANHSIEQRDGLLENSSPDNNVSAWRAVDNTRWPAYCLDGELKVVRRDDWQRVVFLEAEPQPVGLVVDDAEVVPAQPVPFLPLGTPPIRAGHLFSGALISGNRVSLIFDPKTLIAYLAELGE